MKPTSATPEEKKNRKWYVKITDKLKEESFIIKSLIYTFLIMTSLVLAIFTYESDKADALLFVFICYFFYGEWRELLLKEELYALIGGVSDLRHKCDRLSYRLTEKENKDEGF